MNTGGASADYWVLFASGSFLTIDSLIWLSSKDIYSNLFLTIMILGIFLLAIGIVKLLRKPKQSADKSKISTCIPEKDTNKVLGFYSHISRMYNSAINTITAIIFGWISFVGIAINPSVNMPKEYSIFLILVFFLMASYIYYFRILRHGKFITKIVNDLCLRDYIRKELLPLDETLPIFGKLMRRFDMGERKGDDPKKMNLEEKISGFIIIILLFVTAYMVFALPPKTL